MKRYLSPFVSPALVSGAIELYDPVLSALVETGTALEVNTSGLRQSVADTYPGSAAIARFRELGGKRVTIGSDAHRADWFAHGLEDGYRAAVRAGSLSLALRRHEDGVRLDTLEGLHA